MVNLDMSAYQYILVDFYHGGHIVKDPDPKYVGEMGEDGHIIDKDHFSLFELLSYTKDMGYAEVEGFYLIHPKSNEFVLIENDEHLYNIICHLNHLDHLDLFIKHIVNEPLLADETVPCELLCGPEVVEPSENILNKEARSTSTVPENINVQESDADNTFVAEETTNIDVGLASDLSSTGTDKGFEDIGRPSKEDRFAGKLGGGKDYYTSSDIGSDDSTYELDVLAERGIDLPPRMRSKKLGMVFKNAVEFRKAVASYAVENKVHLKIMPNEKDRVRVKCKGGKAKSRVISQFMGDWRMEFNKLTDYADIIKQTNSGSSFWEFIENNMCETFNSWIVGPKHKSVITMLEEIRYKIMNKTIEIRKFAETWVTDIVPIARMILEENKALSRRCKVIWNAEHGFEVDEVCAFYDREMDPDDYVAHWYRKETFLKAYKNFIQSIPNMKMWPDSINPCIEPSEPKPMPCRPKRCRKKAKD
ncbi:uncharacterized protein [Nicotiana tomentosiformis]|uniref:uncharacterized protein n=1 Tax=Nicotiana tomentosiformis TaxID=4098 RepID=UPI00388CEC24